MKRIILHFILNLREKGRLVYEKNVNNYSFYISCFSTASKISVRIYHNSPLVD